jgi:putative SOS response-associated peptidase YedK
MKSWRSQGSTPGGEIIPSPTTTRRPGHIHDRNPVPLPRDMWAEWLDPRVEGTQDFVDRAVAAAIAVAEQLEIVELLAVTDDGPKQIDNPNDLFA